MPQHIFRMRQNPEGVQQMVHATHLDNRPDREADVTGRVLPRSLLRCEEGIELRG